jgi:LemA protein
MPYAQFPMRNSNTRIPEAIAPEILKLAAESYAKHAQSYSATELIQAGSEAQIPAKFTQWAIQEIQLRQKRRQKQRRMLQKIGASILAISTIWSIWTYNTLNRAALKVEAKWAQVENQLQRRADLIPKLTRVAREGVEEEKAIATLLLDSRETYLQAATPAEKVVALAQVNEAIANFQDKAMANPEVRSSQLFINLQYEITGTENRIAVERKRYNEAVQAYNQKIDTFPNSVLAEILGFENQSFF